MNDPNWWVVAGLALDVFGVFAAAGIELDRQPMNPGEKLGTSWLANRIDRARRISTVPHGDKDPEGITAAAEMKYRRLGWMAVGVGFGLQVVGQFLG